jgi:hypothetical protein
MSNDNSNGSCDQIIQDIHDHLRKIGEEVRSNLIELEKFIISKVKKYH